MALTSHLATLLAVLGLASGAAGCGSDTTDNPQDTSGRTEEAPVNPETPATVQGDTTPAPNDTERREDDGG